MKTVELKSTSALRVLAAAAVFGVVSCSGGGGGSGSPPAASPPPAPPPPVNTVPEIVVTVDKSSPDEGQPFVIDASGSTDADGDTLTTSIEQISGPEAGEAPEGLELPVEEGAFGFSAPEVDADQTLVFEVTVSDGEAETVETLEIEAVNISLEPVSEIFSSPRWEIALDGRPVRMREYFYYAGQQRIAGILETGEGVSSFFEIETIEGSVETLKSSELNEGGEQSPVTAFAELSLIANLGGVQDLVVLSASQNMMNLFQTAYETIAEAQFDFKTIPTPCAADEGYLDEEFRFGMTTPPGSLASADLIVGSVQTAESDGGLRVLLNEPDNTASQRPPTPGPLEPPVVVKAEGSFCHIQTIAHGENLAANNIIAANSETQRIHYFVNDGTGKFSEKLQLDVVPDDRPNMRVTKMLGFDPPGADRVFVLLSDGEYNGQSGIVVIEENFTETLSSTFYPIDVGTPSDLVVANWDNDGWLDIAVSAPDLPFLIIYRSEWNGTDLVFNGPEFVELGLGGETLSVSNASAASTKIFGYSDILVGYGSPDVVKFFPNQLLPD